MAGLAETIDDLRRRIVQLERRTRSHNRTGVIEVVDAAAGLVRVRLSTGDEPFLTGWIPWQESSAGANKTHNPPSAGQQVQINSESGDLRDAVVTGSLNSDANARPSAAGDSFVLTSVGDALVTVTGGGAAIVLQVGGVTVTLTDGGLDISGGSVTHNGTNIGDTHKHGGVDTGPSQTETPT